MLAIGPELLMFIRRRYHVQFSLRALIAACVMVTPPLAWIAKIKYDAAQYHRAVYEINKEQVILISNSGESQGTFNGFIQSYIDSGAFPEPNVVCWSGMQQVSPNLASHLPKLKTLRAVHLSRFHTQCSDKPAAKVNWRDPELKQIAKMTSLRSLVLDGEYSPRAIEELAQLPLHQLVLPDSRLTSDTAARFATRSEITSVGFKADGPSLEVWSDLVKLPVLSHLAIYGLPSGEDRFDFLQQSTTLCALSIYQGDLSTDDGRAIASLKLKQVVLVDCSIEPAFFTPFQRTDHIPEFVVKVDQDTRVFAPNEFSDKFMIRKYATPRKAASAESPAGESTDAKSMAPLSPEPSTARSSRAR
jgi:hypothetical protein